LKCKFVVYLFSCANANKKGIWYKFKLNFFRCISGFLFTICFRLASALFSAHILKKKYIRICIKFHTPANTPPSPIFPTPTKTLSLTCSNPTLLLSPLPHAHSNIALGITLSSYWSSFERESGDPTLALSPGGPLLEHSEWIFGSVSQCVFGRARERYSEILFKCSIL